VATGFNKWGMTTSMVAAKILSDLVTGNENKYASLFNPSRSILHPQLFANTFHSVCNLITPTSPRCPHMGCALKWNKTEHSWDCPCHGSRFSDSGELLDNPATDDL
ncbi:MAG: FAD-dependent oxidoreductase, partial [Clostridia bacterium]|nr:FAD-dependent oxidoreductase [Clostridia bacterium]